MVIHGKYAALILHKNLETTKMPSDAGCCKNDFFFLIENN